MLYLRNVTVLWLHQGLEPSSGAFAGDWPYPLADRQAFGDDVRAAATHVRDHRIAQRHKRLMPWLHAGTGEGAAVLNEQGILVLGLALGIVLAGP